MLTESEKFAVRTARYFGPHWGTTNLGFTPEAIVAQLRGARFDEANGAYFNRIEDGIGAEKDPLLSATADVADWLGLDPIEMTQAFLMHGPRLFTRARY
jgi:hypothetical protein